MPSMEGTETDHNTGITTLLFASVRSISLGKSKLIVGIGKRQGWFKEYQFREVKTDCWYR